MYSVVSLIFDICYAAFQGYLLQYFFGSFLEYRGQKDSKKGLYVILSFAFLKLWMGWLLPANWESNRIIENLILHLVILVILAFAFYKAAKAITIYLVITFMAVNQICFFMVYSVFEVGTELYSVWAWCIENGYIKDTQTLEMILEITSSCLILMMLVMVSILSYRSFQKILQSFREKEYAIHKTELFFILAPGMAGLLMCALLRIILFTVENGIPEILYHKYPVLLLIIPAIMILCLMSILYAVKLFQDMISLGRERNSRAVLEKQVDSMQEHMGEMDHIYSDIRSMKHDMKNTISVIMQLAAKDTQNEELNNYLAELNQTMDRLEFRFKTGNTVVDTLLNMKYHEIMRIMPDLQMDAEKLLFPKELKIQSYDIGIILGNALDNAIEACKKQREKEQEEAFIGLYSFSKGKMFFIKVENSFDGEVIRKEGAEFPATTKSDEKVHGIGLTNIKKTAEKYHGGVDWTVSNKTFTLSVMLKNERREEDEL